MNSLFRQRNFYWMLAGNASSSIGSGITMITIPWILVNQHQGERILGLVMMANTLVLFFTTPWIGMLIDHVRRQRLLLFGESMGFAIIGSIAVYGFFHGGYESWHLVLLYFTGSFYYALFFPTMFALNQELFQKEQYKSLSGFMEIQGQLSLVIAGTLATFLIDHISFHWILTMDAFSYLLALFFFSKLPVGKKYGTGTQVAFWQRFSEGYQFMRERPILFWFLLASYMPFLTLMVTNYLFPIYIAQVLHGDGSVYAMQEMMYGIGAALAGLVIPILLRRISTEKMILCTALLYLGVNLMIILVHQVGLYYIFTLGVGLGNAGTRVARNSFMLDQIPGEKIGRVDSLFRVTGFAIRLILLTTFTSLIQRIHVLVPLSVLVGLVTIAVLIIFISLHHIAKLANTANMAQRIALGENS